MKVLGLFSGIGMLEHGFAQAGFEVVASNEVNPLMCKTLTDNKKELFGQDHQLIPGSVHKLSIDDLRKDYRRVNVIVGGFPCVSYSTIADIKGTRAGARYERFDYKRYAALGGDLFLHMVRVIGGMQPEAFVIENVPGVQDARIVLETLKNIPCNDKKNPLGFYYQIFCQVLNAAEFGVPQDRPRFIFIGARRHNSITLERSEVRRRLVVGDILEENPEIDMPEYVMNRLNGKYRDRPIITEAGPDAIAPTCLAHYSKDKGTRLVKVNGRIRPYTPLEYARLQGVPDSVEIAGTDSQKYLQIGNAVVLPLAHAIARGVKRMLNGYDVQGLAPWVVN